MSRDRAAREPGAVLVAGFGAGLMLWVVTFYVIGPVAGWSWFAVMTDPAVHDIAHDALFGIPLGLCGARFRPRPPVA